MTPANNFMWVLLAAGASTRLGQPKQLLSLAQQTLVHCQAQRLLATQLPVCVVEGALPLSAHLPQHKNLQCLYNPQWQQGMGTSIALAMATHKYHHLGFVLVDQYRISATLLEAFYQHWRRGQHAVQACGYQQNKNTLVDDNHWGAPVILHQTICQQFRQCSIVTNTDQRQGLKPWLAAHKKTININIKPWPQAQDDIDTPSQWQAIQQQPNWGACE